MLHRFPALAFAAGLVLAVAARPAGAQPAPPPPPPPEAPIVLPPRPPATPIDLDIGLHAGAAVRFGDAPQFDLESRAGFEIGGAVWISPSPRFALGLEFSHLSIGREHAGPGPGGEIEVSRALNGVWGGLRVDMVRLEGFEGFLSFGPGLVWDTSSATGITGVAIGQPGQPFACSATAGPYLGLRGVLGTAFALGGGLHLAPEVVLEGDQLTDNPVGRCVAGPGSTGVFTFRIGFFFRADVARHVR